MNLRRFISSHIVRQLLSILLPLSVLPIFILGILLLFTGREAAQKAVLRDYEVIAVGVAREFDMEVKGSRDLLQTTAAMLENTKDDRWEQETVLVELKLRARDIEELIFMDLDGTVRASGTTDDALKDTTFARSTREVVAHFKRDSNQDFYKSSIHFIDNISPAVTMAIPIRKLNRPVGILVAQVNFREMWEMVNDIKIGETGRTYVVSEQGVVIAHYLIKNVLMNENLRHLAPVDSVLAGKTGSINYIVPGVGEFLAAFAPLRSIAWGVIVEQPAEEAYATIDTMSRQMWGIMLISAAIAIFIGIMASRSIVRPVLRLVAGTRRVSRGELAHRIDLKRIDEVGQLADAFNEMAASLKGSYDSLEQKVLDRTSQLRQALEEVQRLSEMKSNFVSEVAHELRTPLTSIKMSAETLTLHQSRMTEEMKKEYAETIIEESIRLTRMINNLLDLARIEAGNIHYEKKPVRVEPVVKASFMSAKPSADMKNIRLQLSNPDELPCVLADHDAVRRVFDNLITNAMKYTPNGGAITVALSTNNGHMQVSVSDTGVGIPKRDLPKIFDPFYQVKTPGARKVGTGLGLPIVKSLIEEFGGEISADSIPGEGSVMTFTLPTTSEKESTHGV